MLGLLQVDSVMQLQAYVGAPLKHFLMNILHGPFLLLKYLRSSSLHINTHNICSVQVD